MLNRPVTVIAEKEGGNYRLYDNDKNIRVLNGFGGGTLLTIEEAIQFFGEPINDIGDRTDTAKLEYKYENCQLVIGINESKITMIRIIRD